MKQLRSACASLSLGIFLIDFLFQK